MPRSDHDGSDDSSGAGSDCITKSSHGDRQGSAGYASTAPTGMDVNVMFSTLQGMGGTATLRHLISGFKLSSAMCFDPNEQNKLLRAIAAADGGSAAFECAVRDMASLLPASSCS